MNVMDLTVGLEMDAALSFSFFNAQSEYIPRSKKESNK
jgi:hypothetical protein